MKKMSELEVGESTEATGQCLEVGYFTVDGTDYCGSEDCETTEELGEYLMLVNTAGEHEKEFEIIETLSTNDAGYGLYPELTFEAKRIK